MGYEELDPFKIILDEALDFKKACDSEMLYLADHEFELTLLGMKCEVRLTYQNPKSGAV